MPKSFISLDDLLLSMSKCIPTSLIKKTKTAPYLAFTLLSRAGPSTFLRWANMCRYICGKRGM